MTDDPWQQPGILLRQMGLAQRQALYDDTSRHLGEAAPHIQRRHFESCTRADPAYDAAMAKALGLDVSAAAAE